MRQSGLVTSTEQWWLGALAPLTASTTGATSAVIDLGPQHPSRAGLVGLTVELDDDRRVISARVQPGFLHRGAEKLFEVRDYRQLLMLADRHDWQAPFSGELVAALACEQLLGLSAPPRAVWLRTLLAEVARIGSHLGFLSYIPFALADDALASRVRHARDRGRVLMLALSGNRLHPMLNRLGGLAVDASSEWFDRLALWLGDVESLGLQSAVAGLGLEPGLGNLDHEQVMSYGLSGPASRASGLDWDLRRTPGYLAYPELTFNADIVPGCSGDVTARFEHMEYEMRYSIGLVRQCAERLESIDSPVNIRLSRIIKLPDAEAWLTIEAPLGMAGIHVVSRGATTPWRFKLRTPTFAAVNVLHEVLVGEQADSVPAIVASLGYTIGDLDK